MIMKDITVCCGCRHGHFLSSKISTEVDAEIFFFLETNFHFWYEIQEKKFPGFSAQLNFRSDLKR